MFQLEKVLTHGQFPWLEVQKCELLINGLNQISYFENNLHSMVHFQDFLEQVS